MAGSLSLYANIFGLIAGGVSLLALAVKICRPQLPSNKMKVLDNLFEETENTFKRAIEGGLLEHEFVQATDRQLTELKDRTHHLRSRTCNVTIVGDCTEFLKGTSFVIGRTCRVLEKLRAEVTTLSWEQRRGLTETIPASNIDATPSLSVSLSDPGPRGSPATSPSDRIPHPRSCPLAFPAWKFVRASGRTGKDPFCDPTRGGADVRATDVQRRTSITHTSVTVEQGV